jgi:hypothetical protein
MQPQMNHPQMMQPQMNQQPLMGQVQPNLNQCNLSFMQKKSLLLGNIHPSPAGCVALMAWALGGKLLDVPPIVGVFACSSLLVYSDFGFLFVLIAAMILKSFVADVPISKLLYLLIAVEFVYLYKLIFIPYSYKIYSSIIYLLYKFKF